ncbi:MAG: ribose-phosphate diphosphokinase [Promethearchaeota archaeon]
MIIIPGPASQILGFKIGKLLKTKVVPLDFKRFPDGEAYIRIDGDIQDEHVVVVQSTFPTDPHLIELFLLLDTVKELEASKITAIVPYLAYARQDKRFRPGEAISIKTIIRLIENIGVDELYTINIHEDAILSEFNMPIVNLSAMNAIGSYLKEYDLKDPYIVAPDKGAEFLAKEVAEALHVDFGSFSKKRDYNTGEIKTDKVKLDVNTRDTVIVDDIISTGGTIANAATMLKDQGARRVFVGATHALLIKNARTRIMQAQVEEIIGTDTVLNEVSKISVAPLIANALAKYL